MELVRGTVGTLAHIKDSVNKDGEPTGYATYDLALTDGGAYKFNDLKTRAPKPGQFVTLEPGRFGQMKLAREDGGSSNGHAVSSNGSAASSGGHPESSDGYWRNKTKYEQEEMHPKIELQSYFAQVTNFYVAFAADLSEEEINSLVDQAFAKAKDVYNKVNPK